MAKKAKEMSLRDLFVLKLRALYDIETQLIKALPKIEKKASDKELKSAYRDHLKQTKEHLGRLEQSLKSLNQKPSKTKVEAIRGLIKDAQWLMGKISNSQALDASLIAATSYIEHYEIAGYQSAVDWAKLLGSHDVESLLNLTLEEEKATAKKLNDMAVSQINERANS